MSYDSGEVLQGVDEGWNFLGADLLEWGLGLVVFLMISLFASNPARGMPFMLSGWVVTTTTFAAMRRTFPDERRGLRNAVMTACGFPPIGIPAPAKLQPVWSAAPSRKLSDFSKFQKLGLNELLPSFERDVSAEVEV